MLIIKKAVREELGKGPGDTVHVSVALDSQPREVDVPRELQDALERDPEAKSRFDGMSYSHRKEYAQWVAEAKREETRARRGGQAVEMIRQGKRLM